MKKSGDSTKEAKKSRLLTVLAVLLFGLLILGCMGKLDPVVNLISYRKEDRQNAAFLNSVYPQLTEYIEEKDYQAASDYFHEERDEWLETHTSTNSLAGWYNYFSNREHLQNDPEELEDGWFWELNMKYMTADTSDLYKLAPIPDTIYEDMLSLVDELDANAEYYQTRARDAEQQEEDEALAAARKCASPYKGLSLKYINKTKLGSYDATETIRRVSTDGKIIVYTLYKWYSDTLYNGYAVTSFTCWSCNYSDGKVGGTGSPPHNVSTEYFSGDSSSSSSSSSSSYSSSASTNSDYYDASSYDDEDDFWYDNADDFDDYEEAADYWEENR